MSSIGHPSIKQIPKDSTNAVGHGIIEVVPERTELSAGDGISRVNGARQSIIRGVQRDTTIDVVQGSVRENPNLAINHVEYSNIQEIPNCTSKGPKQSILSNLPKDTSNDVDQNIIRGTPRDKCDSEKLGIAKGISRDASNISGEIISSRTSGDTCKRGGDSIYGGATRETSNDSGDRTARGTSRDTSIGAGPHIFSGKVQNGSQKMGCKKLGSSHKNLSLSRMRPGLWVVVAPALLAALCFAQSLTGEFVHDDVWAILNNPDSRGDTPLRSLFINDFWGKAISDNTSHKSYRPLCVLSFRINVLLGGLDPFYFHAVNVALHCFVSSLLAFTCSRAVFDDQRQALATALLFACHPIHTEAVAGIVGRVDVMSCLLFLLAFLSYTRGAKNRLSGGAQGFPCISNPILLKNEKDLNLGPFLERGTQATRGFDLRAILLMPLREWFSKSMAELLFRENNTKLLIRKAECSSSFPLPPIAQWASAGLRGCLVSLVFLRAAELCALYVGLSLDAVLEAFRMVILPGGMRVSVREVQLSLIGPIIGAWFKTAGFVSHHIPRYQEFYVLDQTPWMDDLLCGIKGCLQYSEEPSPGRHSTWGGSKMAIICLHSSAGSMALSCVTYSFKDMAKRNEHREVMVGLLFLVFPFIPASNLFFRVGFVVAERVLYMPSMGFCILCIHGLKVLFSRTGPRGFNFLTLSFLLLLIFFSCKSVSQSECWRSREALFRSGVQTLPHNAKVHYNYANFLKDQNRKDEARDHYRTVLRLYPQHPSALNNLGTLTANATAAEEYYRKALAISPQHSRALFNLGNLLRTQGRDDEAELLLSESLRYGPYFADAYSSLGSLLADQKRHQEADEVYQTGIINCPDSSDLQNNYGVFLVDVGSSQKAMSHYLLALQLRPDHHVAMLNLGRLYRSLGQNTEAETWYKKALQISRDIDVITPLGALYYNTGKYKEALQLYQEAVRLHPDNVQISLSLAQVLAMIDQTMEAEMLIQRIVEDVPDCFECFRLLSAIYSKKENYLKALEIVDIALQMKPTDPKIMAELHFTKGNQLRELNRLEDSFQSYRIVADVNPSQAQAWMNMGGIKHIQGDYVSARTFYQKALLLDPESKLLKENLAKLQRLENRLQATKAIEPHLQMDQTKGSERIESDEKRGRKGHPRSNVDL
ncbi:transmembrane and TPR repeat-containing 1 isoform X1 [Pelobates cultripes]|uniref:Transmembrane and TPR repeat-containing 1 isoform X1 n=1 Tax=Pelobates cultripes TaxID=61616 RepID=A0AAD1RQN7_PELCU|nr:transmembrane and TPR repeat-containing 1 isoform X1 [Pelobates cultripes]